MRTFALEGERYLAGNGEREGVNGVKKGETRTKKNEISTLNTRAKLKSFLPVQYLNSSSVHMTNSVVLKDF